MTVLLFSIIMELSYSADFISNTFLFLLLLFAIEAVFVTFLKRIFLDEYLLVSPISTAFEILQFITFLRAPNFQFFVLSYFSRLALLLGYKTYFDPIFNNFDRYIRIFGKYVVHQFPATSKYLGHFIAQTDIEKSIQFYMGKKQEAKEIKMVNSVEETLNQMYAYSTKIQAIFLKPIIFLSINLFALETMIPKFYLIRKANFPYYMYFSLVMVLPQIFIDILLLSTLEYIHGFKLLDFFRYVQYRYRTRKMSWILRNFQLDKSIDITLRSLNNMCFSN